MDIIKREAVNNRMSLQSKATNEIENITISSTKTSSNIFNNRFL